MEKIPQNLQMMDDKTVASFFDALKKNHPKKNTDSQFLSIQQSLDTEINLIENDIDEYLKTFLIGPIIKQTHHQDNLMILHERNQAQLDMFNKNNENYHKNNQDFINLLKNQFRIGYSGVGDDWFNFINKNAVTDIKAEIRFYFSANCEHVPNVNMNLLTALNKYKSFRASKINTTNLERLDNLVLYFSESVGSAEINEINNVITDLQRNNQSNELFNNWDVPVPFGVKIPSTLDSNKSIGSIAYNPFRSSRENIVVEIENPLTGSSFSTSAQTPNSILKLLSDEIKSMHKNHNLNYQQLAEVLKNTRLTLRDSEYNLPEYIKNCKKNIKKITSQ